MNENVLLPGGIGNAASGFSDLIAAQGDLNWSELARHATSEISTAEATTVISVRYDGGVLMVGDRQATAGYAVAHRNMDKVFPADEFSVVAISGTAGLAVEMVRLFQTELEHYEKLEGSALSLEGKANYLARMVRQQLPMAFQGLVVIPLFCGFDRHQNVGRCSRLMWSGESTKRKTSERPARDQPKPSRICVLTTRTVSTRPQQLMSRCVPWLPRQNKMWQRVAPTCGVAFFRLS